MSARTAGGGSLIWRILTTPVGPRILPRLERRPGPTAVIRDAGLPAAVAAAVRDTVKRTRLSRSERTDVAAELCGHFADALARGVPAERVVDEFGDRRTAARLIRRAKLRARGMVWRLARRVRQGLAAALVLLALLVLAQVLRFTTATPSIRHNYLADLNAPSLASPIEERAWPLYRRAALARAPTPPELQLAWGPVAPGDPRWDAIVEKVGSNRQAIDLILEATRRPRLGVEFSDQPDPEIWAKRGRAIPTRPATPYPDMRKLDLGPYTILNGLANLLAHEACVAASRGDGATVVRDIAGMVAIAEHLRQTTSLQSQSYALAAFGLAVDTAAMAMREWPSALSDEQWTGAAHTLARFGGGGQVRLRFDQERRYLQDFTQRAYSAGGVITREGLRIMAGTPQGKAERLTAAQAVGLALDAVLVVPSRAEFEAEWEGTVARAEAESALPLYLREGRSLRDAIFQPPRPWELVWPLTAVPQHAAAALRAAGVAAEQAAQRRDAMLVVIALELFKRRHGVYPASLAELVPGLLPAVPMDRYDGGPIKYVLGDSGPVLYVVGTDRRDDGGRPPNGPQYDWRFVDWVSEESLSTTKRFYDPWPRYQGDWVLWPMETPVSAAPAQDAAQKRSRPPSDAGDRP